LLQSLSQRQRCLAFRQVRVFPHQLLHRDLQHLLLSPRLVRPYLQLVQFVALHLQLSTHLAQFSVH
jgi:hypothetical protein